jgi:DNA-binding CsgD family transcriptional regulator
MRTHLERAVELATAQGKAAARCEALTRLAIEAARLGSENRDEELLSLAERSASAAKSLLAGLPGHPQWGPECEAALATVAWARGDVPTAVGQAYAAVQALEASNHEDVYPDVLIPAGTILLTAGPPEAKQFVGGYLRMVLGRILQGTLDEDVRLRWLKGPVGSRLAALAADGAPEAGNLAAEAVDNRAQPTGPAASLDAGERELLLLMTEGLSNREMAERLDIPEASVATRLASLVTAMGATDRAQATTLAMRGLGATLPAAGAGSGAGSGLASVPSPA